MWQSQERRPENISLRGPAPTEPSGHPPQPGLPGAWAFPSPTFPAQAQVGQAGRLPWGQGLWRVMLFCERTAPALGLRAAPPPTPPRLPHRLPRSPGSPGSRLYKHLPLWF